MQAIVLCAGDVVRNKVDRSLFFGVYIRQRCPAEPGTPLKVGKGETRVQNVIGRP